MVFSKEHAYFLGSFLAGQMPIARGVSWLARSIRRAATGQRDQEAQNADPEMKISAEDMKEMKELLDLILEDLQELPSAIANSSRPGSTTESQPSGGHVTQPASGLEETPSGTGCQSAQEQQEPSRDESEPDLETMTDQELIALLLQELRQMQKELKGKLPSLHH